MFSAIAQKLENRKSKVGQKLFGKPSTPPSPSPATPHNPTAPSTAHAHDKASDTPAAPQADNASSAAVAVESAGVPSEAESRKPQPAPAPVAPSHAHTSSMASHPAPTSSAGLTTVPCQYRTGKTLGQGTYAIVKEAVHIKTGKYFACKVINKKLMEGREYMVRNEIAVLKRVSSGQTNIVTLHDYFETAHNLYLVFDLCTGGELFDRICAKGNYYEADAASLVRTIATAVRYIHDCGIVHRDLKPENLLFRTKEEEADIMIADFGLSRIMPEDQFHLLTEICGTPGYMAPEIFRKSGHGKPVDIWAIGVITYFLLCGYTPFDRDNQQQEADAIMAGDYKFEPEEYWSSVSDTARDFVSYCLTMDANARPTAAQLLEHKWLASDKPHFVPDPESPTGGPKDLLPHMKSAFNARKTFRKAVLGMMAVKRMSMATHVSPDEVHALGRNVQQYKSESEKEQVDEDREVHHHFDGQEEKRLKASDDAAQDGAKAIQGRGSTMQGIETEGDGGEDAATPPTSGMGKMSLS